MITTTLRSFTLRSTFVGLVLFLVAPAAGTLLGPMSVPLYKNQLGYSDDEISTLNGLISTGAGAVGATDGAPVGVLTADGRGLRNATVTIIDAEGNRRTATTGSFGNYRFEDV